MPYHGLDELAVICKTCRRFSTSRRGAARKGALLREVRERPAPLVPLLTIPTLLGPRNQGVADRHSLASIYSRLPESRFFFQEQIAPGGRTHVMDRCRHVRSDSIVRTSNFLAHVARLRKYYRAFRPPSSVNRFKLERMAHALIGMDLARK